MAAQSSPFSSSSHNGSFPRDSATHKLALDNLLRRELNISDPNDAQQVANALLSRYKDTPRAISLDREAEGVPFLTKATEMPAMMSASTSSDVELQQAIADVERDLLELTTNSILKDVKVELEGWASAVRMAIAEGVNAARFALDTRQRDKAFGIRRTLGDYARMARLVGVLTPTLNATYRKFAQSLDEVASVLLVKMGEALTSVGGGRFLLQAPYSELQVRRDAVIHALRNLVGSTQEAYGPNDWPRGLDAYRRLYDELESQGQGDLRSLLVENELARIMDNLITRADHGNVEGLRQIGATAQLDLQRFRRLIIVAQRLVRPESPPLTTFLSALQLFTDAFNNSGGVRLIKIARPPILFYGLYGTTSLDDTDKMLLDLISDRGLLAHEIDCLLACGCDENTVLCQIMLDKILYDVDRAIDLYLMSSTRFGLPERRASAYSFIVDAFIAEPPSGETDTARVRVNDVITNVPANVQPRIDELRENNQILDRIYANLRPQSGWLKRPYRDLVKVGRELLALLRNSGTCERIIAEGETYNFCDRNTENTLANLVESQTASETIRGFQARQVITIETFVTLFNEVVDARNHLEQEGVQNIPALPASVWYDFVNIVQQELCIQEDAEQQWENLVATMAPSCVPFAQTVFPILQDLVQSAKDVIGGMDCEEFDTKIPPHYETSLDSLVFGFDSDGAGRI